MENSVLPDEIEKTKLMKMNDKHFFMFPKIMQKCSKLYAFSLIIDLKTSGKGPFLQPHHGYLETFIKPETMYKQPQRSHLFGKGSFVTFDPANLEAIGNKHAVSDSVFKVTRIIEQLDWQGNKCCCGISCDFLFLKLSLIY